jgi:hypothetical protein
MQIHFVVALAATALLATAASAATPPAGARQSPYVDGNADPPLAHGVPNRIAIVAQSPSAGLVILRNNTPRAVEGIWLSFTVKTRAGRLLGTIKRQDPASPFRVSPGEIALASFDFNCGISARRKLGSCHTHRWPTTARFVPSISASVPSAGSKSRYDYPITTSFAPGAVTFSALGQDVIGPAVAMVFCFSAKGRPLFAASLLLIDEPFDMSAAFSFALKSDRLSAGACPVYLATLTGGPHPAGGG